MSTDNISFAKRLSLEGCKIRSVVSVDDDEAFSSPRFHRFRSFAEISAFECVQFSLAPTEKSALCILLFSKAPPRRGRLLIFLPGRKENNMLIFENIFFCQNVDFGAVQKYANLLES